MLRIYCEKSQNRSLFVDLNTIFAFFLTFELTRNGFGYRISGFTGVTPLRWQFFTASLTIKRVPVDEFYWLKVLGAFQASYAISLQLYTTYSMAQTPRPFFSDVKPYLKLGKKNWFGILILSVKLSQLV